MNKGILGEYLSDAQYSWMSSHTSNWCVQNCVAVVYRGSTSQLLLIYKNGDNYVAERQDPEELEPASISISNFMIRMYNGEIPSNYVYLYGNNGTVTVDSYKTLNLGTLPTGRDTTTDYSVIRKTDWVWTNLYNVLSELQPDIHALPDSVVELQNLAFAWDSDMSYRTMSPYMENWKTGRLTEEQIAYYLRTLFGNKWNKLYDLMRMDYNPIENYSMSEIEHIDDVKDEDTQNSINSSSNGSGSNSNSGSGDSSSSRYGFNSVNAVGVSENDDSNQSSSQYSDTDSSQTAGSNSFNANNDIDRTLTRKGNIGTLTTQQMMKSEWEIREKLVLDTIKSDIMSVLTLPIYDI